MSKIKPILNILAYSTNKVSRFVQKPNIININPSELRYVGDELCLNKLISLEEVKALFPSRKLENNYIIEDIKTLLKNIKTNRKLVDLTPELSEKDYAIITKLMNMHNGAYIPVWKGKSGVDNIDNIQKLALFTRTMRLTKQTDEFIGFDMNKWDIVVDGIIRKPKEAIMPLLEYKANSKEINEALSDLSKMTPKIQEKVDMITKYLDAYIVKKDFTVYRGDKSFNILPTVNINGQEIDLSIIIENATLKYQELYKKISFLRNK